MIIIAVLQVKPKEQTKDGRKWIFQVYYKGLDGLNKKYRSRKYMTKKEAQEAERQFLLSLDQNINHKDMTFKDLYLSFYDYQSDKVRESTIKTYRDRVKYLQYFDNIKLKDFNINHFELWKKEINKLPLATSYKNDLFKFIKAILNYGSKWYDFNFTPVYNKMTNFTNPNELKKEMLFFTIDEFNQFISVEDDIMFSGTYEERYTQVFLKQREFLNEIEINPYLEKYAEVTIEACDIFAMNTTTGNIYTFPMKGVERTNPYETSDPVPEFDKVYFRVVIKVDPKDGSGETFIYKTFDAKYYTDISTHYR